MKMAYLAKLQRDGLRFIRGVAGASLLEYALVVCLVAVAVVVTLGNLGAALQNSIWSVMQQAYAAYMTGG